MEKSIESIWKEGFLENHALIAPKLNDLYSQKSKHTIDKFKRMGKMNLYGILIGAVVILGLSLFIDVPIVGAFIFIMLVWLVLVGKRQGKELEKIDTGSSSYDYLKAFDTWLKKSIAEYGRIYRYVYPLLMLAFLLGIMYSNIFKTNNGETPIAKIMNDPDTYLVLGLPIFWILPVLVMLILISYFSDVIYRLDLKSVYGGIFSKLDELLADMEELRK